MDVYTACELSYKNGYEAGIKALRDQILDIPTDRIDAETLNSIVNSLLSTR